MKKKDDFEEDNEEYDYEKDTDEYKEEPSEEADDVEEETEDNDVEEETETNKEAEEKSSEEFNEEENKTEEEPNESENDVDEIINGNNGFEEDDEKSNKRFFVILAAIIGILILIIGGFFIFKHFSTPAGTATIEDLHKLNLEGKGGEKDYVYNGFSFVYFDGLWYTQMQRDNIMWNIPLHFGPKDLENVSITGKGINDSFKKDEVYITFDPTLKPLSYVALSAAELSSNLIKGIGVMPIAACLKNETDACSDRPIITCESGEAAIYLKQSNETKISLEGNCVILEGQDYELVKATDRFLLQWYRIMD
jgi:hypothetical protein